MVPLPSSPNPRPVTISAFILCPDHLVFAAFGKLAARDLGLGTVWVGVYPEVARIEGFRSLFNIPEHIIPFAPIPVGWPDGGFSSVNRSNPALVHRESWEGM